MLKNKNNSEKLIKISSQFVELTRNYGKVFGFKWAPLMSEDSSQIRFGRTTDGEVTLIHQVLCRELFQISFQSFNLQKTLAMRRVIQSGMIVVKNDKKLL